MHEAGVKLATGTDAGGPVGYNFQGYNTPWELELFVECGMSPMEALVAGTRNGAEVIGVQDRLGTLEPGKWADLLILEADPLENIRNVRKIESVIQAGKVHDRDAFAYISHQTTRTK
jgi:imidazolonepropionase-like amidohydrolase